MKTISVFILLFMLTSSPVIAQGVSAEDLTAAVATFDATEVTASNYLKRAACDSASPPCRSGVATVEIIRARTMAWLARQSLERFFAANPGAPIPLNLYTVMVGAMTELQTILTRYQIS